MSSKTNYSTSEIKYNIDVVIQKYIIDSGENILKINEIRSRLYKQFGITEKVGHLCVPK